MYPEAVICEAIARQQLLSFTYYRAPRVCEPHVFGMADRNEQLLAYQVHGPRRAGHQSAWRCFDVRRMRQWALLPERFSGARPLAAESRQPFPIVLAALK